MKDTTIICHAHTTVRALHIRLEYSSSILIIYAHLFGCVRSSVPCNQYSWSNYDRQSSLRPVNPLVSSFVRTSRYVPYTVGTVGTIATSVTVVAAGTVVAVAAAVAVGTVPTICRVFTARAVPTSGAVYTRFSCKALRDRKEQEISEGNRNNRWFSEKPQAQAPAFATHTMVARSILAAPDAILAV